MRARIVFPGGSAEHLLANGPLGLRRFSPANGDCGKWSPRRRHRPRTSSQPRSPWAREGRVPLPRSAEERCAASFDVGLAFRGGAWCSRSKLGGSLFLSVQPASVVTFAQRVQQAASARYGDVCIIFECRFSTRARGSVLSTGAPLHLRCGTWQLFGRPMPPTVACLSPRPRPCCAAPSKPRPRRHG